MKEAMAPYPVVVLQTFFFIFQTPTMHDCCYARFFYCLISFFKKRASAVAKSTVYQGKSIFSDHDADQGYCS